MLLGVASVPQPGPPGHAVVLGTWVVQAGRCCKRLTGFGLVLGHFGEDSKKQLFALDWMLAGVEGDSWIGILARFF